MPEHDPNQIDRLCEEIAKLQPSAEATGRAVARVRQELLADQRNHPPKRFRRIFMRFGIPSAIAACVALAIILGLSLSNTATPTASAAELYKETVKALAEYKGWVHIKSSRLMLTKDGSQPAPGYDPIWPAGQVHFNTADGTHVYVDDDHDEAEDLEIDFASPSQSTCWHYTRRSGELRVRDMVPVTREKKTESAERSDYLQDTLKRLTHDYGKYDLTRSEKDGMVRYDFKPLENVAGPEYTILVDSKDKLIRKQITRTPRTDGGEHTEQVTEEYTYGPPIIKDIYDLNVPRNTKIVDCRSDADVKALMKRLAQQAHDRDFGNGLAVVTCNYTIPDSKVSGDLGTVCVYGKRGEERFTYRYGVAGDRIRSHDLYNPLPAGWPRPGVDDVIKLLDKGRPCDGEAIGGFMDDRGTRVIWGLAGEIWDGWLTSQYEKMAMTKGQIIHDERDHKGLVGLKVLVSHRNMEDAQDTTLWVDPSRNDVPVEKIVRRPMYDMRARPYYVEERTKYTDFNQLPNKRWYPTKWTWTRKVDGEEYTMQYLLRILPDAKMDDKWFADPRKRFKTRAIDPVEAFDHAKPLTLPITRASTQPTTSPATQPAAK